MGDFFILIFISLGKGWIKLKAKMGSKKAQSQLVAIARQNAQYQATMAAIRMIGDKTNRAICDMAGLDYQKTCDHFFNKNLELTQ